MPVKYKLLDSGQGTEFYFERSLDLIFSPGCFTVEIEHGDDDVGLPVGYCGREHYIVGTLMVTDNGVSNLQRDNRLTGQTLIFTSRKNKETKVYTRTYADGMWSEWSSLARAATTADIQDNSITMQKLSTDVQELFTVPNHNNYIKNWVTGNKLVVRVYIENKEVALADNLYIKQIAISSGGTYSVVFNSDSQAWYPQIHHTGEYDVIETTNYTVGGVKGKYGKIALRMDWSSLAVGNNVSAPSASYASGTNLEDICFIREEFYKPLKISVKVAEESITEAKLSHEVVEKIEKGALVANEVALLSDVVNDVVVIPNNNNYIKNWEIGNKLVVRLFVENKELALADKLYLRAVFKLSVTNYGINLGNSNNGWAIAIGPNIGPFDVYETVNYECDGIKGKYGKIAVRMDWEAIDWGSSTSKNIPAQDESNLEDICFSWEEFTKPLVSSPKIADESIDIDKLKNSLAEKVAPFAKYELFSLGDSLSAGGVWQEKVADILGCAFDQGKNIKDGAMLSVGGTSSFGKTFDNVLWRTKNLIDQNYISGKGENAIVILENVNDGSSKTFDETEKTIIPTTPIEGYSDDRFTTDGSAFLEEIKDKASLNAVLRLTKTKEGKNLRIDTLPTKAGNVTLTVGWPGMYSKYNVYVVPQATDVETMDYILDKILEYSFTGATDTMGEDGCSVDFSNNEDHFPAISVSFTDTDGTGLACTVTDNPNAKTSVARYFIGDSVDEWTDVSKWQLGITYSQGWKSTIEMLQRAYPKLHIFVSLFPLHAVTASNYLLPNGTYDSAAYDKSGRMVSMRKMQVELSKIARFYSLPFIDVFAECGIGISNMLEFYNATANVHPKNEGYYRFGETVAVQLKRYMI